jgi:hypothetical protein
VVAGDWTVNARASIIEEMLMRRQSMVPMCIACCTWLLPMQALLAQAPGERLSGEVMNLDDGKLTIKTAAGEQLIVALADNARVTIRAPGDLSRLDQGLYVGVTAVPQADGTLLASQINVFPESMRGTGEGHRPMANLPGSTMTNATVQHVVNVVTNASVTGVGGTADTRRLVLSYAGGQKTVIVPSSAVVVISEIGDRNALVRGAHVVVYTTRRPDGSLVSERVSVGKNGSVPVS